MAHSPQICPTLAEISTFSFQIFGMSVFPFSHVRDTRAAMSVPFAFPFLSRYRSWPVKFTPSVYFTGWLSTFSFQFSAFLCSNNRK